MYLAANVHCWNYSKLLTHMLTGFQLFPPSRHLFSLTVCYDPDDKDTLRVMDFFLSKERLGNYRLYGMPMTTADLCARAIGKNRFAQQVLADVAATDATVKPDWVFYTDCDYSVSGHGDLDRICDVLEATVPEHAVYWPTRVQAWDYDISERSIACCKWPQYIAIDPSLAVPHRIKVAIGGVQFVPVAVLQKTGGYCQGGRQQRPSPNGWRENKEDKAFRKQVGHTIPLPPFPLYRMRHRARGAAGKVEL